MLQVMSVRLRELQVGGKKGRVGLPCDHRPSVCLLSLFGFSSLGQRSRGTGENLVSNARKKKKKTGKLLENSVTLDRKKTRLPG